MKKIQLNNYLYMHFIQSVSVDESMLVRCTFIVQLDLSFYTCKGVVFNGWNGMGGNNNCLLESKKVHTQYEVSLWSIRNVPSWSQIMHGNLVSRPSHNSIKHNFKCKFAISFSHFALGAHLSPPHSWLLTRCPFTIPKLLLI